jgi:site-specific recombinase XerD
MIGFFIRQYGWTSWEQVSIQWVETYISSRLCEGIAPTTLNWDLSNFRMFCHFLVDEGYNLSHSVFKVKLLKRPRRLPRPLTDEQVARLEHQIQLTINGAESDSRRELATRDMACFYLLWHCGLRISEVCSLKLGDIDLQGRKVYIHDSKNRKDRMVYMSNTTIGAVRQYMAASTHLHSNYLFGARGGAMGPRTLQRRLRNHGHQCGVAVTARRLRHTFASQMLAAGVPVTSIQRYLGHQSLDTTMIYTGVSDPLLRQDYYRGMAAIDSKSTSPFSRSKQFTTPFE